MVSKVSVYPIVAMLLLLSGGGQASLVSPDAFNGEILYAYGGGVNGKFCYQIKVGAYIRQDTSSSTSQCKASRFGTNYKLGNYASTDQTAKSQKYTGGTSTGCPSRKKRGSTLQLNIDNSKSGMSVSVHEPSVCFYTIVITAPASMLATTTTTADTATTVRTTTMTTTQTTTTPSVSTTTITTIEPTTAVTTTKPATTVVSPPVVLAPPLPPATPPVTPPATTIAPNPCVILPATTTVPNPCAVAIPAQQGTFSSAFLAQDEAVVQKPVGTTQAKALQPWGVALLGSAAMLGLGLLGRVATRSFRDSQIDPYSTFTRVGAGSEEGFELEAAEGDGLE